MTDRPAGDPSPKQDISPGTRWGRIPAWWLDHPDLDADGLAVLAALATYADDTGVCWPSQATLAAKLKRSRPTINRILGRLDAAGLVAIEHRSSATGGRLTCRYRLRLTPAAASDTPVAAAVAAVNIPDSAAHIPCPPPSQEQPQPEQIPDSLQGRARKGEGGSAREGSARRGSDLPADVPADWQPSAEDRLWAAERTAGLPLDLDRHAELFAIRCRAHGYRYRDIGAAWRSWLIQDMQTAPQARPAGSAPPRSRSPRSSRSEEAEQRLSAWAAVAARLQPAPASSTAAPVSPAWTRP